MKRQTRNGMFVPVAQYKAQEATKFLNISRAVDYLYNSVTHNSILTQKRTMKKNLQFTHLLVNQWFRVDATL